MRYGERRARFRIDSLTLLYGDVPPRVRDLVVEWARLHQRELADGWQLAAARQPLRPIEPLD